ncbi:hypothetical protein [Thalassotalea marina]|uniref:Uncharacterized protein n=1 Tax=Thalassotalea marina TaxID=1673741 RepID=A0A919EI18_9GAMM|nr:hypothetical protein [Thalassotalea marina]GHF82809.1 hypothetical protein GCM10017161_07550 [Thalassotalea marina]
MTRQGQTNKREKSMGENIVIITMVAGLMAIFIYYAFRQEGEITQVGFESLANTFSSKVTSIRAQWFMENQPKVVTPKGKTLQIRVNEKGWVDYSPEQGHCVKTWQAIMQPDLTFMNQVVAAIEVNNEQRIESVFCRYQLPSGQYFDYFPTTGKVEGSR